MDFYVPIMWVINGPFGGCFGPIFRCWGHEVPCWRCFGQGGPRNAIWGMGSCRAFVGGVALIFFALQALDSARLALFLPRAGAFMWVYVAVSAGGFLCAFMWATACTHQPATPGGGTAGGLSSALGASDLLKGDFPALPARAGGLHRPPPP